MIVAKDITVMGADWDDGENDRAMREQHRVGPQPREFDADPVSPELFQYPLRDGKDA